MNGELSAVRIIVVDDHPLVREGIRQALSVPGFEVVAESGSGEEGLSLIRALRPDVVLMDITLPGITGIEAVGLMRHESPGTRVLMLSVHDHTEYVLESVRAGAHGYLRKDALPADLRAAVNAVAEGRTMFGSGSTPLAEAVAPVVVTAADRLELLTRREREVLVGIASGQSNKEVAAQLGLSVRTIESYRETLTGKLGVAGTAGLTRLAIESGLLGK